MPLTKCALTCSWSPPTAEAQSFDDEWQQELSKFQSSGPMSRLEEPRLRGAHRAAIAGPEQAHRSVLRAQTPCSVGRQVRIHWSGSNDKPVGNTDFTHAVLSILSCYDTAVNLAFELWFFLSFFLHRHQSKGNTKGNVKFSGSAKQ